MAEEVTSPKGPASPAGHGLRRALTVDESAHFRHRPNRLSTSSDALSPGGARRRSSNFSEYSLSEVRKQFQSSTDDILLPKPSTGDHGMSTPSHWHSAPLVFALLPAIGGMLFQNGSAVVTDVMLLGLAAIFLNWSVRLPWDWYHSAQAIRKMDEDSGGIAIDDESGEDNTVEASQTSLNDVPEDGPTPERKKTRAEMRPAHRKASNELYIHEISALLFCFIFPVIGAYLLHSIRGYLSRPSEGLVSNYNLTIFLLASELRPMSHLFKLVQARTLHLQRVVNTNPYDNHGEKEGELRNLVKRLAELETRTFAEPTPNIGASEPTLNGKQTAIMTTEVRRTLQPELDALNRAVRRYEKRATLQTMQTESRLLDLEARLADAISLAAAAAQTSHRQRYGFWRMLVEWIASGIVLPLQALSTVATLPFKTAMALMDLAKAATIGSRQGERGRKAAHGRPASHGRMGTDRLQGKGLKR